MTGRARLRLFCSPSAESMSLKHGVIIITGVIPRAPHTEHKAANYLAQGRADLAQGRAQLRYSSSPPALPAPPATPALG